MTNRHVTRRLVLIGCGVSLAALACGDDSDGAESGPGTTSGNAGGSNAGGASAGGNSAGGQNAGGQNAGGQNAGGQNAGGQNAGGQNAGGQGGAPSNACSATLLVKGSNYNADPHDLSIPMADLVAALQKTYTTTGNGHDHEITLTNADFLALQNGQTVTKYVCLENPNFSDHEFAISCANPNIMPVLQGEIGTPNNCPA